MYLAYTVKNIQELGGHAIVDQYVYEKCFLVLWIWGFSEPYNSIVSRERWAESLVSHIVLG